MKKNVKIFKDDNLEKQKKKTILNQIKSNKFLILLKYLQPIKKKTLVTSYFIAVKKGQLQYEKRSRVNPLKHEFQFH